MANGTMIGQGASAGAALGTLIAPGFGTAAGAVIGAGLGAIPALVTRDENERRLRELRRMQEMGTLGLTEAEKQAIYGSQQSALQGQLQQAQSQIRAAGAAGMAGGAGAEQLRQLQLGEQQARAMAESARQVEAQDLLRQRELEDEIQQRIAVQSLAEQERLQASMSIPMEAAGGFVKQQIGAMLDIQQAPAAAPTEVMTWAKGLGIDPSKYSADQLSELYKLKQASSQYNYLMGGS